MKNQVRIIYIALYFFIGNTFAQDELRIAYFSQELEDKFHKPIQISFNLTARQFRQHDLAQKLFEITNNYNINPSSIEFEITESVIMKDPELA